MFFNSFHSVVLLQNYNSFRVFFHFLYLFIFRNNSFYKSFFWLISLKKIVSKYNLKKHVCFLYWIVLCIIFKPRGCYVGFYVSVCGFILFHFSNLSFRFKFTLYLLWAHRCWWELWWRKLNPTWWRQYSLGFVHVTAGGGKHGSKWEV